MRYKCFTKASEWETGAARNMYPWAMSRRAWFEVYDDRIQCGDWKVPVSSIEEAVLFETRQWFMKVHVLRIVTKDTTYQFGFNPWSRVAAHLPFEVEHRRARTRRSFLGLAMRVAMLVLVVYWLWQKFGQS